jgi:hypothetical protein
MTINVIGVGLGVAGWKLLQNKSVSRISRPSPRTPILQRDLAYLRETLPTKATAKDLLADRRLQEMVLKAYRAGLADRHERADAEGAGQRPR